MTDSGRPRGAELLSLASHQLKTPLAVIAGHAELMLTRASTENVRVEAEYIADAAAQLGRMLDAVLAVFAVDTARVPGEQRDVAVADLFGRAMGATPSLRGRRPRLPAGRFDQVVSGDEGRLAQALAALLATGYAGLPDGEELALEVEERRGVTMLSITSDAAWEIGDSARLAFYVAARLLEADGSSLFVREQAGAVSSVVLMLATPEDPELVQQSRVLIVDDDDTMRRLLRATLPEAEGFVIVEASDGRKALDLLERDEQIDLVLLDWMMPGRSGADVLEQLRSRHPEVPVIVVTAELEPRQKELAESLGADIFLTKPFSPLQLLEHVERMLPGRASDPARRDY